MSSFMPWRESKIDANDPLTMKQGPNLLETKRYTAGELRKSTNEIIVRAVALLPDDEECFAVPAQVGFEPQPQPTGAITESDNEPEQPDDDNAGDSNG